MFHGSDMFQDKHVFTRDQRRKTLKLELEIRNALHRLATHIQTMHNELSLLPVRRALGLWMPSC